MRTPAALFGAAVLLAACQHVQVTDDRLGYERRRAELGAVAAWDIRGGIAVDTGEESYQSRFRWRQRGDELALEVRGRLGIGSFRVEGDESRLTVTSRGETEVLTDPERQLSERLGWWLPVTSAEHWLLGHADPEFPSESQRGRFDTLSRLDQRDWTIQYREYQIAAGRLVPRRITLTDPPLELSVTILAWDEVSDEP